MSDPMSVVRNVALMHPYDRYRGVCRFCNAPSKGGLHGDDCVWVQAFAMCSSGAKTPSAKRRCFSDAIDDQRHTKPTHRLVLTEAMDYCATCVKEQAWRGHLDPVGGGGYLAAVPIKTK